MKGRALRLVTGWSVGLLLAAGSLFAQGATADFEPVDYVVRVDGRLADTAEVFQSRIAGAFLILSDELQVPVLLRLRDATVETVNLMKVDRRADGGLTLLPEPVTSSEGSFSVSGDGEGVSFAIGGRRVELRQKPPLLGRQDLAGMQEYSADYVRAAAAYSPSRPILERLRSEDRAVTLEVYFGSWCPFCQQVLPRIMRVGEELAGSNIRVDYYGLPRGFGSDPKASALKITGVPTGVVFIGGREAGRITGNAWKIPELSLNKILVTQ